MGSHGKPPNSKYRRCLRGLGQSGNSVASAYAVECEKARLFQRAV